MALSLPSVDAWAVIVSVAIACLGLFQWWLTYRNETRKRDTELFDWSREVISSICAVEAHCRLLSAGKSSPFVIDQIAANLIALTDTGRLFFPNQNGLRPRALDEVIRAYRAADIVSRYPHMSSELADKLRKTSRDFVVLLQKEMSRAMRRQITDAARAGDAIGWDPSKWFSDLEQMRSEIRELHPSKHVSSGVFGQGELATMNYDHLVERMLADGYLSTAEKHQIPSSSAGT